MMNNHFNKPKPPKKHGNQQNINCHIIPVIISFAPFPLQILYCIALFSATIVCGKNKIS